MDVEIYKLSDLKPQMNVGFGVVMLLPVWVWLHESGGAQGN